MTFRYLEDFTAGDVLEYGDYEVTAEDIISFAREFDPQPFHLNEEAARASILGGLAASGWHTAAISMRLNVEGLLHDVASLGSPGVPEMNWRKPLLAGSHVHMRTHIRTARKSLSRPGIGILELEFQMRDQNDTLIMNNLGTSFVGTRDGGGRGPGMIDPSIAATGEPWLVPDNVVRDPAELPDDHGLLSGWWDDMVIGSTVATGAYRFTAENVIAFAQKWDPQYFHTDPEAARNGPFGGHAASGWHTGAAGMSCHVASRSAMTREALRRGLPEAPKGPSPGFRNLRWIKPVYAGDTISYYMTVENKRKSSRPGWGMMFSHFQGINQHGIKVYEYHSAALWPVRG